jgi:hypothetical protein
MAKRRPGMRDHVLDGAALSGCTEKREYKDLHIAREGYVFVHFALGGGGGRWTHQGGEKHKKNRPPSLSH